jgi:hypothetical protein
MECSPGEAEQNTESAEVRSVRRLALAVAILAIAAAPAESRGGGHGSHGGRAHAGHHHHHGQHSGRFPFLAVPFAGAYGHFPYGYPCWWEEGHWVTQLYGDRYGNYTEVPVWIPEQWVCAADLEDSAS